MKNRKIGIPLFITEESKLFWGVVLGIVAVALYLPANHIHLFEPKYLPLLWIDRATPFLPWTVWIYLSEYAFFGVVYLMTRDMENLNKYFYSFLSLQTVSVIIFWIWPTTYPREWFPLTGDMETLTNRIFSALRTTDSPANCAPSLHVSSVFLSVFLYLDEQRGKFPYFLVWGLLIAASTLTTKQHYIVDVVSGILMAILFYLVFHRLVPYRELNSGHSKKIDNKAPQSAQTVK